MWGSWWLSHGGSLLPSRPSQAGPALHEVLGCFAVSCCLSGTTTEPWSLSQGRADSPMPLPTYLRYGEGRIFSAHHWLQLLLLSLPRRPHVSGPCQLLSSILPQRSPCALLSCSCLMPLVFLVSYSSLGFVTPAGKRPQATGCGETLISKQAAQTT